MLANALSKVWGSASRQATTQGFGQSARGIDELRTRANEDVTRADQRDVGLHLLATMFDRCEELRIEANYASEDLCIGTIILPVALVNLAQLAGIGNDNLVAAADDEAADPPECVPVSSATRAGTRALKYSCNAA